jgi:cold shock CspA family protein
MERLTGTVREWNRTYGFLTWFMESPQGARRRQSFVHYSEILMPGRRELQPGQTVEFELEQDDTGRERAIRVEIIQPAETAA